MNSSAVIMMAKLLVIVQGMRDSFMGIVYPSEAVARGWDGALQTRLQRAPLERFLRAQGIVPAPRGISQDSDDLVRATVLIVEAGLALYFVDRKEGLAFGQRAVVGHVTCLISRALAEPIAQPNAWRIVALVSTARLLTPWIGLNAAAMASASAARQFQKEVTKGISPLDWRIMKSASDAVSGNGVDAKATASANIAARLNAETPAAEVWAAQALQGLNKSFRSGA
jgi:hypothetical protein